MNYQELIGSADRIRFRTACATLLDEALAEALCALVEEAPLPPDQRLALLLRLFTDLPLYAVLSAVKRLYPELLPHERTALWAALAAHLARERSAAADAVETSLYADFLEDPATAEEAFSALCAPGAGEPALRSLLRVSAPVPWRLKRVLYQRLLPEARWHPLIFQSVQSGLHALCGPTLDPREAHDLLALLELPDRSAERDRLLARLGQGHLFAQT